MHRYWESSAQAYWYDKHSKYVDCFQEKLVPDYDVTQYFKAYVGAIDSQPNPGINDLDLP